MESSTCLVPRRAVPSSGCLRNRQGVNAVDRFLRRSVGASVTTSSTTQAGYLGDHGPPRHRRNGRRVDRLLAKVERWFIAVAMLVMTAPAFSPRREIPGFEFEVDGGPNFAGVDGLGGLFGFPRHRQRNTSPSI